MAGSIKYFVYTDDAGEDWALRRDESNVEAVNGAASGDYPNTGSTVRYELPRNVRPRTATYVSADGTVRRKVVVLTAARYATLATDAPSFTDQVSNVTVSLKLQDGERVSLPFGADTGLNDGDAT